MAMSLTLILTASSLVFLQPSPAIPPPPAPLQLTPNSPIVIDGDANFTATAQLGGWPGDGSPEDPFIIDGLEIDLAGEESSCIMIHNTRVNFTIRNCILTGSGAWAYGGGIHLWNVAYGELVNNTCNNNLVGIYIMDSDHNTVANNTCNSNDYGINLWGCSDFNTVTSNTCKYNGIGISTSCSSYNTIKNNTCTSNIHDGISLFASYNREEYNTVADNTCNSNTWNGISLLSTASNTVDNNTCNFNEIGILL